ncbi:Hypothetical protein A7982_02092 [Minicystis rosea]|nr:Hypothetical protein A7982_02092 [Minicystis rosea]
MPRRALLPLNQRPLAQQALVAKFAAHRSAQNPRCDCSSNRGKLTITKTRFPHRFVLRTVRADLLSRPARVSAEAHVALEAEIRKGGGRTNHAQRMAIVLPNASTQRECFGMVVLQSKKAQRARQARTLRVTRSER